MNECINNTKTNLVQSIMISKQIHNIYGLFKKCILYNTQIKHDVMDFLSLFVFRN